MGRGGSPRLPIADDEEEEDEDDAGPNIVDIVDALLTPRGRVVSENMPIFNPGPAIVC